MAPTRRGDRARRETRLLRPLLSSARGWTTAGISACSEEAPRGEHRVGVRGSQTDQSGPRQNDPGSFGWLGAVHVHHGFTASSPDHDEGGLLVQGVALSVDHTPGDVDEVPRPGLLLVASSRAELHPELPGHHIDGGLVIAVVVPTRGHTGLGTTRPAHMLSEATASSRVIPEVGADERSCWRTTRRRSEDTCSHLPVRYSEQHIQKRGRGSRNSASASAPVRTGDACIGRTTASGSRTD